MLGKRSRGLAAPAWACLVAIAAAWTLSVSTARADHGQPHFSGPFFSQEAAFGFAKPIGMAIAPDGRMFFVDDAGIVKTKAAGIGGKATELFDLSDHVNEVQDRGLISVAVDRGYGTTNRSIYLAYVFEDRSPEELDDDPSLRQLPKTQRLVRVEVPAMLPPPGDPIVLEPDDEQVVLGSYSSDPLRPGAPFSQAHACPQPSDLVDGNWAVANETDCIPSDSHEHTIDSIRVDPGDGSLWLSVGDGAGGASTLEPDSWRSQRNESYSGKVLHVDTVGQGLPGHPFCPSEADLTKTCTKVYAKGFRNPYRFFLRPAPDGRPVVADAGWESSEELDLAEPGKNYGWPCREGAIATPTWSERSECTELPAATFAGPLYDYPQIEDGAVIGGITYGGKIGGDSSLEYPAEYKDAIFFNDYGNERVWYLRLDEAGTGVAPGYPKVFADDLMAVDWATAPNGELMYVDIGFGASGFAQVRQISFDPDNAPPEAVAKADKTFGAAPLTVQFDASDSSDPDGDDLEYAWDLDGDGETDKTGEETEETYVADEQVTVTLRVDDGHGHQDTASIDLFPGDEGPPVPAFTAGPTTYENGSQIVLEGAATDPDDGELGAAALSWEVKLDHAGTHIHPWLEVDGDDSVQFTTDTAHDSPSTYVIELTATDEHGLSATTTRVLEPVTRTVRIEGVPSGGPIVYGGTNQTTPYEKKSTIGLIATVSAAPSFIQSAGLFTFDSWLDGAPRIRNLVVPDHDVTLTAVYRAPTADTVPVPAPKPDGPAKDSAGPRLFFNPTRGLVDGSKAILRGEVRDPSGVRRVLVALRAVKREDGLCRWWSRPSGSFAKPRSCGAPVYMPTRLVGAAAESRWLLQLRGPLPPGRYLLFFRTIDAAGNDGLGPGGRRSIPLLVPGGGSSDHEHAGDHHHQRANH